MSRRLLIGVTVALLLIGVWVGLRGQNQSERAMLYTTGTAFYHALETQVYATWTP